MTCVAMPTRYGVGHLAARPKESVRTNKDSVQSVWTMRHVLRKLDCANESGHNINPTKQARWLFKLSGSVHILLG